MVALCLQVMVSLAMSPSKTAAVETDTSSSLGAVTADQSCDYLCATSERILKKLFPSPIKRIH